MRPARELAMHNPRRITSTVISSCTILNNINLYNGIRSVDYNGKEAATVESDGSDSSIRHQR